MTTLPRNAAQGMIPAALEDGLPGVGSNCIDEAYAFP